MRTLSASELVTVWERGIGLLPIERALVLLASARPDLPLAALPHITVGQRDGELLTLREANFGSQMTAVVTCPDCGTDLELTFDLSELRPGGSAGESSQDSNASPSASPWAGHEDEAKPRVLSVEAPGYEVRFRLPTSSDLAHVAG